MAGQRIAPDSSTANAMRRRLARQVAAATPENGGVDPSVLSDGVAAHAVQFRAVLENMAQGLCLFDRKQQLIVCNHRYAEIYGLSAEHVRPGATLRESSSSGI